MKGYYVLQFAGTDLALYGTHTGGETVAKSLEVALGTRPSTMVKVPGGGEEYRDLELELEDRPADGLFLDEFIQTVIESNSAPLNTDGTPGINLDVQLAMCSDAKFINKRSVLTLKNAWVSDYTLPDGDRKANEVRTMSVTISHRGSVFALGASAGES
jgi:hypothetical protein